jgi:hypothetical protein
VPLSSTQRALIAIAVILCLIAATAGIYLYRQHGPLPPAVAGPPPDLLSQLPADAPVIAYVDVAALRSLQHSPLAAILELSSPGPQADREYSDFVRATGFDYTRDLDKVAIAFWPQSLPAQPGLLGDNRVLSIADGRFDKKKIEAYALRSGKITPRGTHVIYDVPGTPPVAFEFDSPARISLASGKNGSDLLAGPGSAPRDPATRVRIGRVAGAPIFAVARTDDLPASFYANFRNSPQLEHLVRSVRGLSLAGKPDGDKIKVALDAECDSMKSALELATLLDGFRFFGSLTLADPKTRRQMTPEQWRFLKALLDRVKVTHQDKWVRLTLGITPEMLGARPSSPLAH